MLTSKSPFTSFNGFPFSLFIICLVVLLPDVRLEIKTIRLTKKGLSFLSQKIRKLSLWKKAIPRNPSDITKSSKICDIHFDDSDVLKTVLKTVNGKRIEVRRDVELKLQLYQSNFQVRN